ncbi:MAG: DnaJ domain-containing protein [Sulfuricurvum sp.]|nr:DnaJ domain-containing protein [Sulfuricurvum sp.]MDD2784544.1 DnaJ domain-containing protein [Sulfuricurvum sp.]
MDTLPLYFISGHRMTQIFLLIFVITIFYWVYKGYSRNQVVYSKKQFQHFVITKEHLAKSELGLFVALVAKVAKADGRVDELEAELVSNMFNDISTLFPDPEAAKNILKQIFDIEKQVPDNLVLVTQALYNALHNDPHKRQKMMEFLVNLSYIDGVLSTTEEAMLHTIAIHLYLSADMLSAMLQQFGSYHRHSVKENSISQAYTLLGLSSDATNDAVKKAYRSLVREYHPDIIKAQGASDEYLKEATEKVQEINAAYEMIKKSRGI